MNISSLGIAGLMVFAISCGSKVGTSDLNDAAKSEVNIEKFFGTYLVDSDRNLSKAEARDIGYALTISGDVSDDELSGYTELKTKNKNTGDFLKIVATTSRRVEEGNTSTGPGSTMQLVFVPKNGKDSNFLEQSINGWKASGNTTSEVGPNFITNGRTVTLEKGNLKSSVKIRKTIVKINDKEISNTLKIEFTGDFKKHYLSLRTNDGYESNLREGEWTAKYKKVTELPEDLLRR